MKVYVVYNWCGTKAIARTYKAAVQFMLRQGMIQDNDEIDTGEHSTTPKSIREYLGENWQDIIANKWTIKDFRKHCGGDIDQGIYEVNLIEETS